MKYVNFSFLPNKNLRITLLPEGQTELLPDQDDEDFEFDQSDDTLYDLLHYQICNGWEWILPEDVGALTSAPLLSDNAVRDENGKLLTLECVYAYMDYQVKSPVKELLDNGYVDFVYAELLCTFNFQIKVDNTVGE